MLERRISLEEHLTDLKSKTKRALDESSKKAVTWFSSTEESDLN